MIRVLVFLFLSLNIANAQFVPFAFFGTNVPAAGGGGPTGDLLTETFEGSNSGYDLTAWTPGGDSNPDPDYATSPAPLSGSQSLRVLVAAANTSKTDHNITASSEVWIRFKFRIVSKTGESRLLYLLDNGGNIQAFTSFDTSDSAPVFHWYDSTTGRDAVASAATTINTTYFGFLHYKIASGGGNNGVLDMEYATTNSRLGSGTKYSQITNGNGTANISVIRLGTSNAETGEFIIDDVLVSSTGYP